MFSPAADHRSSDSAAENIHPVGSVSEDARVSWSEHRRTLPDNERIRRSGSQRSVQRSCHERFEGNREGEPNRTLRVRQVLRDSLGRSSEDIIELWNRSDQQFRSSDVKLWMIQFFSLIPTLTCFCLCVSVRLCRVQETIRWV